LLRRNENKNRKDNRSIFLEKLKKLITIKVKQIELNQFSEIKN